MISRLPEKVNFLHCLRVQVLGVISVLTPTPFKSGLQSAGRIGYTAYLDGGASRTTTCGLSGMSIAAKALHHEGVE